MKPTQTQIENAAEAINTLAAELDRQDCAVAKCCRDQFSDLVTVFRHWREMHERRRNVAKRGGEAIGKRLTQEQRSERARNAAKARHAK